MTEGIIIAIIGAVGVVLAAVIGLFKKSNNADKNLKIKQKQGVGNKGTQIGIQNNYGFCYRKKGEERNEWWIGNRTKTKFR